MYTQLVYLLTIPTPNDLESDDKVTWVYEDTHKFSMYTPSGQSPSLLHTHAHMHSLSHHESNESRDLGRWSPEAYGSHPVLFYMMAE